MKHKLADTNLYVPVTQSTYKITENSSSLTS